MVDIMPATQHHLFVTQFNDLADALAPWVIDTDDGQFIGDGAPPDLVETYQRMRCVGYARGWL